MVQAMNGTVDEVIRVAEAEGIDADIRRTDELMVATNPAQLARAAGRGGASPALGRGRTASSRSAPTRLAGPRPHPRHPGRHGGHRRRPHPACQTGARAWRRAVERAGVTIAEGTAVTAIAPGHVTTRPRHGPRARSSCAATEGFTTTLPGLERDWLPLNSAQIATEPLPPEVWDQIGWQGHEILGDIANAYCYCQRTREGRITVGARGVPYRYGFRTRPPRRARCRDHPPPDRDPAPALPGRGRCRIDHAWCGVLGVPRDWCATVGLDRATGIGWAGGYVGVGVSTSNLAGRTLADLALNRDTDLTRLPWVSRRVRRWEPEPLRWLGVTGMYALLNAADRRETATNGPPSRLGRLGNWLTGR